MFDRSILCFSWKMVKGPTLFCTLTSIALTQHALHFLSLFLSRVLLLNEWIKYVQALLINRLHGKTFDMHLANRSV